MKIIIQLLAIFGISLLAVACGGDDDKVTPTATPLPPALSTVIDDKNITKAVLVYNEIETYLEETMPAAWQGNPSTTPRYELRIVPWTEAAEACTYGINPFAPDATLSRIHINFEATLSDLETGDVIGHTWFAATPADDCPQWIDHRGTKSVFTVPDPRFYLGWLLKVTTALPNFPRPSATPPEGLPFGLVMAAKNVIFNDARLSPDGKLIAVERQDNTGGLAVWSAEDGNLLYTLTEDDTTGFAWSNDSLRLLASKYSGDVLVWDMTTGNIQHTFRHEWTVDEAIWNSDETLILVRSRWNTLVRDAITGEQRLVLPETPEWSYAIWSTGGTRILRWSGNTAAVFDVFSGEEVLTVKHAEDIKSAAWNFNDSRFLTLSGSAVTIWDVANGEAVQTLTLEEAATHATWNADGTCIMTSYHSYSEDFISHADIWDAVTGERVFQLSYDDESIRYAGWSSDPATIFTWGGAKGRIQLWDATTGSSRLRFEYGRSLFTAHYSPENRIVLAVRQDGVVVWPLPAE